MTSGVQYRAGRYAMDSGKLVKTYGPFADRETAEWVAARAAEKHPGDVVVATEGELPKSAPLD